MSSEENTGASVKVTTEPERNGVSSRARKKTAQDMAVHMEAVPVPTEKLVGLAVDAEAEITKAALAAIAAATINLQIEAVPLDKIRPGKFNFRLKESPERLEALTEAMRRHGFLGVLIGRRQGDVVEVVCGQQRLRAAELAGLSYVPVQVRDLEDATFFEIAVQENFLHESLTPLEEALTIQKMLETGYSLEDTARHTGRSAAFLNSRLALLRYSEIEEALRNDSIDAEIAEELAGIEDASMRGKLLRQTVAGKRHWTRFIIPRGDLSARHLSANRVEALGTESETPLWTVRGKPRKTEPKPFRPLPVADQYKQLEKLVQDFVDELERQDLKAFGEDEEWRKKSYKLLKTAKRTINTRLDKLE